MWSFLVLPLAHLSDILVSNRCNILREKFCFFRRIPPKMKSADTRSCGKLDDEERGSVAPAPDDRRPLDGGWGWVCVLGCTFMHFLIGGYGRSYGLIYLELRSHFDSSAALTAWVGGACVAVRMGCSEWSSR